MTRREEKCVYATDVIDVTDARRLQSAYTARSLRFQSLVLRYISQILHGCTNAYCTTPTCLSCNKRLLSRPHRPPTHLTARALAYYLATQDDPHRALCPHQLNVDPILPRPPLVLSELRQSKVDPKSLSQNLYNANILLSLSYGTWSDLPAVFSELRARKPPGAIHVEKKPSHSSNGHATNASVNPRQSSITSKILNNGEQIHKIRHVLDSPLDHAPGVTGQEHKNSKIRSKIDAMQSHAKPKPVSSKFVKTTSNEKDEPPTFSNEKRIALPVTSHLTCDILDKLIHQVQRNRKPAWLTVDLFVEQDNTDLQFGGDPPFVRRSIFYALSDPEILLKSFKDMSNPAYATSPLPHLDAHRLTATFRDWNDRNKDFTYPCLAMAVDALFRPPPELDVQKSPRLKPSSSRHSSEPSPPARYLSNEEAAHIIMICIHALTAFPHCGRPDAWMEVRRGRSKGIFFTQQSSYQNNTSGPGGRISLTDQLESEPAFLLAEKLLRGIGTRMCFEHILVSLGHADKTPLSPLLAVLIQHLVVVERNWKADWEQKPPNHGPAQNVAEWTVSKVFLEWLRTVIIKKFEGKAEVNKWSSVGTAMIILDAFFKRMPLLNVQSYPFWTPYLNETMDSFQEPIDFLDWTERPNTLHVLQYPFLFGRRELATYFRTINLRKMLDQVQVAGRMQQLERRFEPLLDDADWPVLERRLQVTRDEFLLLKITRAEPLKSTLDYLWGRERRMLLKPLKVSIGDTEGELGFDQGGVTYEFFRLVLAEAFQPDNGLFTVDPRTHMTWFHMAPLEPMKTYEMLGVLFSLAVYNGITLPVTFPITFYAQLLGEDHPHVRRNDRYHICDGWPDLSKSFGELINYDGDVEDVFMRQYTFSFDYYDRKVDIDMQTGKVATADTALVTNANRVQFCRDYVDHLVFKSVRSQLAAFRRGFWTCLHPRSLDFFDAYTLRLLIEGSQHISVRDLRSCTCYESPYHAHHPTITTFWAIVEQYDQDALKRLLEFVTANDRVPITGYASMTFVIERGGEDSDALPTSSTCFGKLYLREYASREKMRGKLEIALRYAKGFGIV